MRWRIGTAAVLLIGAGLLIVSENSSDGTDLRPGRYNDLATLVSGESQRVKDQQARVADLQTEVDELTRGVSDKRSDNLRGRARAVGDDAGLAPVTGQGITIVLSDAPPDSINDASEIDLNRFVVHQQDIQAVVNAMWAGGAQAVTVQGQRIISTTGIKCEGNSVTLQGVPYPQPYVISAVGDQSILLAALEVNRSLDAYRADAGNPEIGVGWDLSMQTEMLAPGYEGLLDLSYAAVDR